MAGPPKRANKRKRSSSAAQHIVVDKAQVTVTSGSLYERFKGLIPLFTGLAALAAVIGFAYNYWPRWATTVNEPTLQENLTKLQADFNKKIGETKEVVIGHSDKNTKEVKDDVGLLAKTLTVITRKQDQSEVRALEGQQRLLFVQRQNVLNSLSALEVQLAAKPADPFLTQRKGELESIKGNLDREFDAVAADLRRARAQ